MEIKKVEVKVGGAIGVVVRAEVGESTNCYIVSDPKTNEAFIIDPGGDMEKILEAVQGLKVKAVLLTHFHYDHSKMSPELGLELNIPVWLHEGENKFFEKAVERFFEPLNKCKGHHFFKDEKKFFLGNEPLTVIHTPGHSLGSVCFYDGEKTLFTGDTLFAGSIGRYTHSGVYEKDLEESVKKILSFPPETRVLPGHGPETTIAAEQHLIIPADRKLDIEGP
ncbi:MBL fold metallo-hydrolase [Candidatus Margulisiibacteriota bacterium]